MFDENIDFTDPKIIQYQKFLENVSHFEALSQTLLGVVDASNSLYLYSSDQKNHDILKTGRTYSPEPMHYAYGSDNIVFIKPITDQYIAIKYENSDILLVQNYMMPKSNVIAIPNTISAYQVCMVRSSLIVYCCKTDDDKNDAYLYCLSLKKVKRLNLNPDLRILKIESNNDGLLFLYYENNLFVIHDLVRNTPVHEILETTVPNEILLFNKFLILASERKLMIINLNKKGFVPSFITLDTINDKALKKIYGHENIIYLVFEDSISTCKITDNRSLELVSRMSISSICTRPHKVCKLKNLRILQNHFYYLIQVFDQDDTYLNDLILKAKREEVQQPRLSFGGNSNSMQIDVVEGSSRRKIKTLISYDEESGIIITDTNHIMAFSPKDCKIVKEVHLPEINILSAQFIAKDKLLLVYEDSKRHKLFDIFMIGKMNLKTNSSEYFTSRGVKFPSFIVLLSNGKIITENTQPHDLKQKLAEEKKSAKDGGQEIKEETDFTFGMAGEMESGHGSNAIERGRTLTQEQSLPFFSDKSPIRADTGVSELQKFHLQYSKTIDESTINEMQAEEVKKEGKVSMTKEFKENIFNPTQDEKAAKKKELVCISMISFKTNQSISNLIENTKSEILDIIELGSTKFLAFKKRQEPKVLQIYDVQKKKGLINATFVNKIGDVLALGGSKAIITTINNAGYKDLMVILDWKKNLVLMAIECHNITNIFGVACNHLIWNEMTANGPVLSSINLSNCKYPEDCKDISENLEFSICSGKTMAKEILVKPKNVCFIKRKREQYMIYYDEFENSDTFVRMRITKLNYHMLGTLHASLNGHYSKAVIKQVYQYLYPRYRDCSE